MCSRTECLNAWCYGTGVNDSEQVTLALRLSRRDSPR